MARRHPPAWRAPPPRGTPPAPPPPAGAPATAACCPPGRTRQRGVTAGLRLIHLHQAVVIVGDRSEVTWGPAVHEGKVIDAGHPPLGHLRQLPLGEPGQLGEEQWIEVRVLRRSA